MANEKGDTENKKSSSRRRSGGRSSSSRGRGRGGKRQSARAAEPKVLESATEEEVEISAEQAEAAPETGASSRDGDDAPEEQAAAAKESAPVAKAEVVADGGITPFARQFFLSRGILTAPTVRTEEDLGEEINHELPSRPKRNTPPSLMKSGREWLSALFVAMEVEVEPKSRYDKEDKTLYFELSGEGAQSLLGANGASPRVLEAMEKVLQQFLGLDDTDYQVHIDVDNFRETRSVRLRALAGQLATLSKDLDKAITIAGMNEFERRVVHRALSDAGDIETDSHGYGTFRKIRLQPN